MYKTVIRVMMIGMVAMLGVKVEAHYMYVSGKYYYHSVGCQATIGSVPYPPDPLEVKCQVNATKVELLCPGEDPEILNFEESPLSLVAHVQIPPGQTQVEVLVDDSPLRNLCACDPEDDCDPLQDIKALVRNMVSTVTISKCASLVGDPCSVLLVTSTATASCILPEGYSIYNYPPDPDYPWQFTCTYLSIQHAL